MTKIYTEEGWLDIPAILNQGCWLNVIIGTRQIGKTFGVTKYLVENRIPHIYMRRTKDELDVITDDPDLNPYLALRKVGLKADLISVRSGWQITTETEVESEEGVITEEEKIGIGLPLGRIAKLRGFSGDSYNELVFDEFIPEKLVIQRKSEGDAFRNAIITIEGNRVLEKKPPLRVWLLANANDLFSPIAIAMKLVPKIEEMTRRGQEVRVYEKEGILICLPSGEAVTKKRMNDPILSYLNDDSAFADMAFRNTFSYNDTGKVKPKEIRGWKPMFRTARFYVWKRGQHLYVCRSAHKVGKLYTASDDDRIRCNLDYPEMTALYRYDFITFSDAEILYEFRLYFSIKN